MDCPLLSRDGQEILLRFCAKEPDAAASLAHHPETCPACARFIAGQRAVEEALDLWVPPPVTADFDRRLYQRIESRPAWRMTLLKWMPAAAVACLLVTAGILIDKPVPAPDSPVAETQSDQVEQALDALDTLSEFSRNTLSQ